MAATGLDARHERLLKSLALAAFFVFFNGYMLAPLIPALGREFGASEQSVGWIVPAYLLPYGFSTLFYGPLSDRVGRRKVLLWLLAVSAGVALCLAQAPSLPALIALRVLSGVCAGGIVPISLALVGDLYPFRQLGRAMGWMFGAIAGGMSCGSTLGAWLNPYIGWRNEFVLMAIGNLVAFACISRAYAALAAPPSASSARPREVFRIYVNLLRDPAARRVYGLIFLNGLFHSGVFSWLGYYFSRRYGLGDIGIGNALLGYGLPGMFLGPPLGKLADRFGRGRIVPIGFELAALCAFALALRLPLLFAACLVTLLSVGFDMTHPLLTGIVSTLNPARRGQAMGLNAFAVFTGFGMGSLIFQLLVPYGLGWALSLFAALQIMLGLFSWRALHAEPARV